MPIETAGLSRPFRLYDRRLLIDNTTASQILFSQYGYGLLNGARAIVLQSPPILQTIFHSSAVTG